MNSGAIVFGLQLKLQEEGVYMSSRKKSHNSMLTEKWFSLSLGTIWPESGGLQVRLWEGLTYLEAVTVVFV